MSSFETMCGMIATGIGVGVLPESCAARYMRADMPIDVVRLSDAWSIRERHIIFRDIDALPLCARAFVDTLIEVQNRWPHAPRA
jgi:DNA-binding transcriptional LysR family regulator